MRFYVVLLVHLCWDVIGFIEQITFKGSQVALFPGPAQLSITCSTFARGESLETRLGIKSKQWMVSGSLGHLRNHAVKQPKNNTLANLFHCGLGMDKFKAVSFFNRLLFGMDIKPDACFLHDIF